MNESKVVLIKGSQSEWFDQAIFILKKPVCAVNKDLVKEAERIINNYMLSGKVSFSHPALEMYKSTIKENAKQKQLTVPTATIAPVSATKAPAPKKKKVDYVSVIINICLIICSMLFGFMLHEIMSY